MRTRTTKFIFRHDAIGTVDEFIQCLFGELRGRSDHIVGQLFEEALEGFDFENMCPVLTRNYEILRQSEDVFGEQFCRNNIISYQSSGRKRVWDYDLFLFPTSPSEFEEEKDKKLVIRCIPKNKRGPRAGPPRSQPLSLDVNIVSAQEHAGLPAIAWIGSDDTVERILNQHCNVYASPDVTILGVYRVATSAFRLVAIRDVAQYKPYGETDHIVVHYEARNTLHRVYKGRLELEKRLGMQLPIYHT